MFTTTFIGSSLRTAVRNSAINMAKPPSPTNAMTWRSGNACCIAMAYGSPGAMVARLPER